MVELKASVTQRLRANEFLSSQNSVDSSATYVLDVQRTRENERIDGDNGLNNQMFKSDLPCNICCK